VNYLDSLASIELSPLELDALTELVNLGVSNAALSLRDMVREEVTLSVPSVQIVTREEAIAHLGEPEARRLVGVNQEFEGEIRGRALVIFPETKSFELVRAVVGGDLSLDDIFELEQEALAETGNILLNGCLGTIANHLGRTLKVSLPEVIYGEGPEFFDATPYSKTDRVLFIHINFAVQQRDIQGYIAMLLDMPSLVTLKELIDEFIERTAGGAQPAATNDA
jgi:chemotaxis protein CheC